MYFVGATAVLISLLLFPNVSAGVEGASNPPAAFQVADCEAYLTGPDGQELIRRGEEWLRALPAGRYMTPRRVEIQDGETLAPEILNPKVVWFTLDPSQSYETVRERFHDARERADQFHLGQVRTLQGDSPVPDGGGEAEPLSNLEKAALGITSVGTVYLSDIRVRIDPPRPQGLRLSVQVDGLASSHLALPLSSLRPGFRDNIVLWLASQLKSDEVPVMLPSSSSPEERKKSIHGFLEEHGQFGLFRKSNGRTFAYVFSVQSLNGDASDPDGFVVDIYSVMPCSHRQMMKGDLYFPLIRGNQTYLCVSDTYLKLQVPFAPAPEGERPVGWTDRQFQL